MRCPSGHQENMCSWTQTPKVRSPRLRSPSLRSDSAGPCCDRSTNVRATTWRSTPVQDRLRAVQVARRRGDVIVVGVRTSRLTPTGYVRTIYTADEIDAIGVFCPDVDRCYLIPATHLEGRGMLHLRLEPARNGQRGAVTMAARYEFGAIAQLGERLGGTQKVAGSSPASSTPEGTEIGSHEFREHFGWYLERCLGGEQFLITRRGKCHARLVPP